MQNIVTRQNEKGKNVEVVIYSEYVHSSGFVVREMLETKNEVMRFQAGRHVMRPMRIPVYQGAMVSHHKDGDNIQKFEIHGTGRTVAEALNNASDNLLRREVKKDEAKSEILA